MALLATSRLGTVAQDPPLKWYNMSAPSNPITGNPTDQHGFDVVHTTNIVQCNIMIDGSTQTYLAYDSDDEGNHIYLYYSNSTIGPWTPYSANPILTSTGRFRTPSVAFTGGVFEMFLNNVTKKDVERWTGNDGTTFTYSETVLTTANDPWTNPFVWLNPNDNNWNLFWVDGNNAGGTWTIYARNSNSITGLGPQTDTLVMSTTSSTLPNLSFPTIMHRHGHYWLLCEALSSTNWGIYAFVSTSAISGYAQCPNSPILTNDEACPKVFIADDSVSCYLFTDQNSSSLYQEERTVSGDYYLTVETSPPGVNSPTGEGWYDSGSSAPISTPQDIDIVTGSSRYYFTGWTGDPEIANSSSLSTTVQMDEDKTVAANYVIQYKLSMSTNSGTTSPSIGDNWYDVGSTVTILATAPSSGAGEQYVWNGWTGAGSDGNTTAFNPAQVTMNSAVNETASWTHQYYLTVTSLHDTAGGAGWYDSGSTAYATLTDGIVSGDAGTQYVFTSWGTDASRTNYAQSDAITMDGTKTATANWKTQYQVSFVITPSGSGSTAPADTNVWQDAGSLSISALADPGYMFSNWSSNTGSITFVDSTFPATTTTINGPGNITATFEAANATLTVRGDNDRIYYRPYNWTTSSWGDWNELPAGTTTDSPATAICGGKQYFIVRGEDGYSLWFSWVNLTDGSSPGWTWMPGSTPSTPTLITNGTALILVVRGSDNTIYYRVYDVQTQTWNAWHGLPAGTTCDKVGAAIFGGTLQLVVRGFSATDANINNTLWYATMDLASNTFFSWTFLPGSTPSTPILAAWGSNQLCLVVRGDDNTLYINTFNGTSWQGWTGLSSGSTLESPAATVTGDTLIIVVVGMDGNTLWQSSLDLKTSSFSGWLWITGSTPSPPILTS